jgi:coenzyme PQQ biosynthesis protein PqqD
MSLDLDERFALSRHAALKLRAEGVILVLPERAIRVGGSGGEILQLCDGRRSGRQIVGALCSRYPDDPEIERQVIAFLAEMQALGSVVTNASDIARTSKTIGPSKPVTDPQR